MHKRRRDRQRVGGSNQYRSRGSTQPARRREPSDLEDIAFAFHPDRDVWLDAEFTAAEAQGWIRAGATVDEAVNWRVARYDPEVAAGWIAVGVRDPHGVTGACTSVTVGDGSVYKHHGCSYTGDRTEGVVWVINADGVTERIYRNEIDVHPGSRFRSVTYTDDLHPGG